MFGRNWFRLVSVIALLVVLAFVHPGRAPGAAPRSKTPEKSGDDLAKLPAVFAKAAPEGVADLKEIQEHVKKVLKKVTPATVAIRIGNTVASGVIIDAEGHILTAGHVSGRPGRTCVIIFPDGKEVQGKTLGQNVSIDSGLIKIMARGNYPHVEMGDSDKVKPGQWVLCLGHPRGFMKGLTSVVRLGRVFSTSTSFIRTDP
jgi:serine protease Do